VAPLGVSDGRPGLSRGLILKNIRLAAHHAGQRDERLSRVGLAERNELRDGRRDRPEAHAGDKMGVGHEGSRESGLYFGAGELTSRAQYRLRSARTGPRTRRGSRHQRAPCQQVTMPIAKERTVVAMEFTSAKAAMKTAHCAGPLVVAGVRIVQRGSVRARAQKSASSACWQ
jgi:hypothetical protein